MKNYLMVFVTWTNKHPRLMKGISVFNVVGFVLLTLLYALVGQFWTAGAMFFLLFASVYDLIKEIKKGKETGN